MVLIAHADVTAYSELPKAAFAEMHQAISDIETALKAAYGPDKMNYLMLMMVDPHVHYHVIPRYSDDRPEEDPGWPGPPVLSASADESPADVRDTLKSVWP
jgi:diadenosine tetraphosphate (Ap4A) HIT family hydrolase